MLYVADVSALTFGSLAVHTWVLLDSFHAALLSICYASSPSERQKEVYTPSGRKIT